MGGKDNYLTEGFFFENKKNLIEVNCLILKI